jgi:glycosyltransferase involved in cell wall biosynthesis
VIIPTYRRKESVYKLLRLLKEQQGIDLQIVLIDQNSYGFFDKQAFENDNRVTYVHQASPNVAAARNTGFLKAVFETILFIDDDLEPDPHFCQSGMEIFEQYAEIGAFVPMVYDLQGETLAYRRNELYKLKQHSLNRHIFSISDTMSAAVFSKGPGDLIAPFFNFQKQGKIRNFSYE